MPSWQELLQRQSSRKIYTAEITLARPDGQGGTETKALLLSTHAIHPARAAQYHEPRLKGVPYYKQAIQEVRLGRSMIGHGRLEILAGDGGLDTDLSNWRWAGRPVTIKLGFEELDTSEYQPVFTGRAGQPEWRDQVITLSIQDRQIDLWRKHLAAGTYSDTLPNLVATCLTAAGITDKDQALWDAWAAENNFSCWVQSSGDDGEEVGRILDRLLAPLACWYGFDRSGRFIIGTFKAPAGDADLVLDNQPERLISFRGRRQQQYWRVTAEYISATGSPPTYSSRSRQDADIQAINPEARTATRRTCLTTQADADTILDRWWNLLSPVRTTLEVEAKVEPTTLRLHHVVHLVRDRFGIDGLYRVVGFTENYEHSRVAMELWA